MEELQKKTKKTATSKKVLDTKTEGAKTKKSSSTVKMPKVTKTENETTKTRTKSTKTVASDKAPRTATTTRTPKTAKRSEAPGVAKTSKTNAAKQTKEVTVSKEPKTTKSSTTKKVTKEPSFTIKKEAKEEQINIIQEPKLVKKHEKKVEQPKVTKTVKKEKESKDKHINKTNKRYIEISIGAIVCAIIIFLLLVFNVKLGVRAYNVITNNPKSNTNIELESDESVTQEVGNIIENDSQIALDLQEKITFPTNVTASIFNKEAFNIDTIPNNLKLMMGWAKTEDEYKLKSINEKNKQVEAIEKERMKESLKNIFGKDIKYRNESFDNNEIGTFASSSKNQGTTTYNNGLYTSVTSQISANNKPFIYQEIQKIVKYSKTIVVHAKVAFIDVEGTNYIVYKNFNDNKFEQELLELKKEELIQSETFNLATGEGTVTVDSNKHLDSIRDNLDTYKYTFEIDEITGEYYLSKFSKSLDE